jgi:4-hydroxybenzoate polyprenyltransferase
MAFNRIADLSYDARNPRTATRALPAGLLSVSFVWGFTIASALLFLVAAAMLNRLTLFLAPIALASVLLYSFTKRWTLLSHVALGWCLSIAPTAAWIAVRGELSSVVGRAQFARRSFPGARRSVFCDQARPDSVGRCRRDGGIAFVSTPPCQSR